MEIYEDLKCYTHLRRIARMHPDVAPDVERAFAAIREQVEELRAELNSLKSKQPVASPTTFADNREPCEVLEIRLKSPWSSKVQARKISPTEIVLRSSVASRDDVLLAPHTIGAAYRLSRDLFGIVLIAPVRKSKHKSSNLVVIATTDEVDAFFSGLAVDASHESNAFSCVYKLNPGRVRLFPKHFVFFDANDSFALSPGEVEISLSPQGSKFFSLAMTTREDVVYELISIDAERLNEVSQWAADHSKKAPRGDSKRQRVDGVEAEEEHVQEDENSEENDSDFQGGSEEESSGSSSEDSEDEVAD